MSMKTPKVFGFCTHLDVRDFRGQTHVYTRLGGLKVVDINLQMFLGMVKETSKDKKWSKGSKECAEGQGKAIQSVIHPEW